MPDRQHTPLPDVVLDPDYFETVRETAGRVFDSGNVSAPTKVAIRAFLEIVETPGDPGLSLTARAEMADDHLTEADLTVPVDQIPGHDPGEKPLPVDEDHLGLAQTLARSVLLGSMPKTQPRR